MNLRSGHRLSFGALAHEAGRLRVPDRASLRLKDPANFRYIGKENPPSIDLADMLAGRAVYGIDVAPEGLLHAAIARPPVVGGKLVSFDASQAVKVPGVLRVIPLQSTPLPAANHPLGGVAVVATDTWAALRGRDALITQWDDGPNATYDSEHYKTVLESAVRAPASAVRDDGNAPVVLATSKRYGSWLNTTSRMWRMPGWSPGGRLPT